MKIKQFLTLAISAVALCANAQSGSDFMQAYQKADVTVPFDVKSPGKEYKVTWGMDTAWDWDYNVMRGIAHNRSGNFGTGRISFQPYNLVGEDKGDGKFGLSDGQVRKLQWRIDLIKRTGTTKVNINCDHEALAKKMDVDGNLGENDYVGRSNYVSYPFDASKWVAVIKATAKYAQAQGLEIESVSPFNEPDYGWNQYYNGGEGASVSNQTSYGIPAFKAIAKAMKEDPFFEGIRICGGNTLNCDRASAWYEGLKPYVDEGNTHQLAGTFENYANFFANVSQDGKVATGDELHNVGEAIVGANYGMTHGIWWGFDGKARGQFMIDSNEGVRIGYGEDRTHWTSSAVYRNDVDHEVHGYIGTSERQANPSTYQFVSTTKDVYFNGKGPARQWAYTTVGGASGSYQKGQINQELIFDITYGEDVAPFYVDGTYQIMNANSKMMVTSKGNPNDITCETRSGSSTQQWHVYPSYTDGDCSYWFIDNSADATQHLNLRDRNLSSGAKILTYNANHEDVEQFYIKYAKDGYFYILTRLSNKYLYANGNSVSVVDAPAANISAAEYKKYLWRFMPIDAEAETTAPASPTGLAATPQVGSVKLTWNTVSEDKTVTYNVLRADGGEWNTIARGITGTTFTDNTAIAGNYYNYKVQTVDYSGNRSSLSSPVVTQTANEYGLIMQLGFENNMNDATVNKNNAVGYTTSYNTTTKKLGSYSLRLNNGYAMLPYSVAQNDEMTIAMWVYLSSNTSWQRVFDFGNDESHYMFFTPTNGSKMRFVMKNGGEEEILEGTSAISRYSWKHVAITIGTDETTLYIDGSKVASKAFSIKPSDIKASLCYLGRSMFNADPLFNGYLDDVRIYNYALTASQVSQVKNNQTITNPTKPSADQSDMTGLIINPTIIQNGTTNDMPEGWTAAITNVTGNGHCTEGVGDTRLEAWHWTADLNADYYQTITVPNGLYTLTAVTHQRENGNASLYGETYRSFETLMPVGDGNEAVTTVQQILVTDGTLKIGVKVSDAGNWMTADNFTLTYNGVPTDLSHYTNAIAYLNGLADIELARNIDHTELEAARSAANSCEANVSSYEKAINDYVAAIKRSQAMSEPEAEVGQDVSYLLPVEWIGETGGYQGASERYNWDNPYSAGRVLYQEIEGLIPGASYQIDFYAVANVARNLDAKQYSGKGIAYLFANDVEEDIEVLYQSGCTPTDYPRTLIAVADAEGKIAYGIANRKAGGQWYVAKAKSLKCLGFAHDANLTVRAGVYGTFVAPYDVVLPEGITAYSAEQSETTVKLTAVADGGKTLAALTPVIVKNTTNAKITRDYTGYCANENLVSDGTLAGFLKSGEKVPIGAYVLQDQGEGQKFYVVADEFKGSKNRCYLVAPSTESNSNLRIVVEVETGVEVFEEIDDANMQYYSVNGMKLVNPQKGINIIRLGNGVMKKIFVK